MMKNGRQGEWHICSKCGGEGHHSAHLGAFSAHEFAEQFSPDEQEDYFAGRYDRSCERCGGSGKVWADTGPCVKADAGDEPCPCGECTAERHRADYEDARMRWAEDGCREDFYYEG